MKPFNIVNSDLGIDGKGSILDVYAPKNLFSVRVNTYCPRHIRAAGTAGPEPDSCLNCRWRAFEDTTQRKFIESNKTTNNQNRMYCCYNDLDPKTLSIIS